MDLTKSQKKYLLAGSSFVLFVVIVVTCLIIWQPDVEAKAVESEVVFNPGEGNYQGVVQFWFIAPDFEKDEVWCYPMKKVEGKDQYTCSVPSRLTKDEKFWVYPSEKYLGDKPVHFKLSTWINSAFLTHLE